MHRIELEIVNDEGLHARPASVLVKIASRYTSAITLCKDGLEIDGKSILGVMTLAAEKGSKILLVVDGEDEEAATEVIVSLFKMGFKEQT